MQPALLLTWCPILLCVVVAGKCAVPTRRVPIAILGAVFWVLVVAVFDSAKGFGATFRDPQMLSALLAGTAAILGVGGWIRGEKIGRMDPVGHVGPRRAGGPVGPIGEDGGTSPFLFQRGVTNGVPFARLVADLLEQFDDWLDRQRQVRDPWPAFSEFVRTAIFQTCGGAHVRVYRILTDGEQLALLDDSSMGKHPHGRRFSARSGVVGHVVTSGRTYLAGDPMQGNLVADLATRDPAPTDEVPPGAWCFVILEGRQRVGLVTVDQLANAPLRDRHLLRGVEKLIGQLWRTLAEVSRSEAAATCDVVTGLRSRESFIEVADECLRDSYQLGEPAAMAVIAFEGLRALDDHGDWEASHTFLRQASTLLESKIRTDDVLGRFDDARVMLLLRRVDSALAVLIMKQLMEKLTALCGERSRWAEQLHIRCGLAGTGTGQPSLRSVVARAIRQCHDARRSEVSMASDLPTAVDRTDKTPKTDRVVVHAH